MRGGAGREAEPRAAVRHRRRAAQAARQRQRGAGGAAQAARQRQRGAGGAAQARRRWRCAGGGAYGGAARVGWRRRARRRRARRRGDRADKALRVWLTLSLRKRRHDVRRESNNGVDEQNTLQEPA